MSEENKTLVRRVIEEVFNGSDMSLAEEVFADHYAHHDPATPELPFGPEAFKQVVGIYRGAYPDGAMTIEHQIAAGDEVVTRWTWRGTHQGPLMGIYPTGVRVEVSGMQIDRISGGKIEETWVSYDALGMMEQMGAVPLPEQVAY